MFGPPPSPSGPSPWMWLSHTQTPRPNLTACRASEFRWGLPSLLSTLLNIPCRLSRVRSEGLNHDDGGGVLSFVPSALCGSPVVRWGKTGFPISPTMQWPRFFHVGLPAAKRLQFRLDWLTEQARYVRGEMTRRTMHASGTFTMSSLSQALPLEYLPFSHSAF